MSKKQLTELAIQKLPPGTYHDMRTPAFGIRIGKTRKTWFYVQTQTRKRESLGHYPAITLSEARKRAQTALYLQDDKLPTITFPDAREAFLALGRWRPQSQRVLRSSLGHFTWKRPIDKITYEDVYDALNAIKAPSARAHAFKDIRTFFNWCIPRYLKSSPCVGIKMPQQPTRNRVLTDDELKAVWTSCEGTFGTIVKLLLLTGQRKMEIGSLQSAYIADDVITLPATLTKNGREHTFPIGPLTKSLLPNRTGYLFTATGSNCIYNGYTYHLKKLQQASDTSNWTIHDLRRTFSTLHAQIGTPLHVTERMLNHASGSLSGVVAVYNRYNYMAEMKEAVERYENHLHTLLPLG